MTTRKAALAALALAVALGVAACTKDDDPGPGGSTTGSASGSPTSTTGGEPAEKVLSFAESDPIARTTGSIPARGGGAKSEATAEVVSLVRGPSSTVLLFKLSTPQGMTPDVAFLEYDNYGKSVDGIALKAGSTVLYPSTYRYGPSPLAQQCLCSQQVTKLGPEGVYVSADFGALPDGTDRATLAIPGLQAVDVPVSAAG